MLTKNFLKFTRSLSCFSKANCSTIYVQPLKNPVRSRSGTGSTQKVTLVPGSGIGPEVTRSVQRIFEAASCPVEWDVIKNFSISNPACMEQLRKNECIILGNLPYKEGEKYINHEQIYKELNLFAKLTYARTLPSVNTRHKNIDVVVIRENTEGEYSGLEHEVYPGVVESIKVITKEASLRLAEYAFEFAHLSQRKKITAVHKANIMKLCDGMFLEATREVAEKYPFIEYEEMIIDNCCMQVVKNPWQFDIMIMPNLYGSIVSNAIAGICGGPGIISGVNIGDENIVFEQGTRHTGADIAGKGLANPTAYILSSIIMLKHMNLPKHASAIESALDKTYKEGKVKTWDFDGKTSTDQFTDEVIRNLEKIE